MTAEEYLDDKLHECYLISYTENGIHIISGIEHSEMCEIMESYHQAKSRWIPVEERLPEFDVPVLVSCKIYGRFLATYEEIGFNFGNWRDMNGQLGIIPPTHWQPLPEPPTQ